MQDSHGGHETVSPVEVKASWQERARETQKQLLASRPSPAAWGLHTYGAD